MTVMLDCNILRSAALFPGGKSALFVEALISAYPVLICSFSMEELARVVARKFPGKGGVIETYIASSGITVFPTPDDIRMDGMPEMRDPEDYPILRSAMDAGVDVLLSGDND